MIGGTSRRAGALAASTAPSEDDRYDAEVARPYLRLVQPVDDDWDDDRDGDWDDHRDDWDDDWDDRQPAVEPDDAPESTPSRRSVVEPTRSTAQPARQDDRLVGVVAAAATPQMLAAVVAFAGHSLIVSDIGIRSFGTLILVQAIAAAVVGLGGLGVPALLRSSPALSLEDAGATSRRLGRFQTPALVVAGAAAVATSVLVAGETVAVSAALFALASAAAIKSATCAALIERSGDHRSGGAAALGTSVIWLAALLGTIEAGYVEYALPIAAVVAELFRAMASRRLTVGIRRTLDVADERAIPSTIGASALQLPAGTQTALVTAAGLVVVALLGDATELGLMAVLVVVLRLVLILEPAVASLGSAFVRPERATHTDRAWRRAARLSDAISIPVAAGAVTAFVVGAPAVSRLVGMGSGTVAATIGLLLISAPATQLLQIGDLAMRSDGRHLLGNIVMAMRIAAVGGLGAAGWLLVEGSGGTNGPVALAAAWALGEWLAIATIVVTTGWRPLDLASIATLIVIAAVGAGLFANDGAQWDPPRLALASVLALVLAVTAPRTVAQLRRIDTTAARHLDRPLATN